MTPRQAWKFGFLLRCADERLSEEETLERIKLAAAYMEKQAGGPLDALSFAGQALYGLGTTGLVAGALGGAGAGYLTAKATEPDVDVEDEKAQELTQAYQIQAARARQARARRGFRQKRPEFMLSPT